MKTKITQKLLNEYHEVQQPETIFIRDATLQGFAIRVTKNGTIAFITEGRIKDGKNKRITIGKYPVFSIQDAKAKATQHLQLMRQGIDPEEHLTLLAKERHEKAVLEKALDESLGNILESFFKTRPLKLKTLKDYRNTINLYFKDWLTRPIRDISRQDIEKRFFKIKESAGRNGTQENGKASAAKAMRILSSVMNYAKAEEIEGVRLITENPVEVLKDKRIDRTIKRRENFLSGQLVTKLLPILLNQNGERSPNLSRLSFYHAIALIIFTGLRREEAFTLKWQDVFLEEEVPYFRIIDTKNDETHYVPLTVSTKHILTKMRELGALITKGQASDYVFPACKGNAGHISEPRKTLDELSERIGKPFTVHDLRRTFATKAQEIGLDIIALKRLLNHKRSSRDVTEGYIINHSKEKLITVRNYLEKIEESILRDENGTGTGEV